MHAEYAIDQAAGLRRLLASAGTRMAAVVGAQANLGSTSVVINLAATLGLSGKDVLVLDENLAHNNVANTLTLKPRYDLLNVINGQCELRDALLDVASGVRVLPVARALQALDKLDEEAQQRFLQLLSLAAKNMDMVLLDAAKEGRSICSSLSSDEPLLLVLNANASAITASYTLLKQLALDNGRRNFDILVNKATSEAEAYAIFDNMAQVARRHLQVKLEYLGHIPVDEKLKRATQLGRPVVELFPAAVASCAMREVAQGLVRPAAVKKAGYDELSAAVQRLMRQLHQLDHRMMAAVS